MPSDRALAWIDRLIWTLVFGGLFALILGLVARPQDTAIGWSLIVAGALAAVAGVILIWVRSRLDESG